MAETTGDEHISSEAEPIFTLHITGLPNDIKQRELYLLFRESGGYQFCNLRSNPHGVSAFATFSDPESAQRAKNRFDGEVFDPDNEAVRLRIEMAKQNSRKRSLHDGQSSASVGQKRQWDATYAGASFPSGDFVAQPDVSAAYASYGAQPAEAFQQQYGGYPQYGAYGAVGYGVPPPQQPAMSRPKLNGGMGSSSNPPCPTLFLANLSGKCTEAELQEVMRFFQGFTKLKFSQKGNGAIAFCEFVDEASSTQALQQLNGYVLPSHDPSQGGIRAEYAKARMGHKIS
jgi:hypothetical protein